MKDSKRIEELIVELQAFGLHWNITRSEHSVPGVAVKLQEARKLLEQAEAAIVEAEKHGPTSRGGPSFIYGLNQVKAKGPSKIVVTKRSATVSKSRKKY